MPIVLQGWLATSRRTAIKILILDIEISPSIAAVWGLWGQNIPIGSITGESEVLSWSAKWHGSDECYYSSLRMAGHNPRGKKKMLTEIHKLMEEADTIVGYNTDRFDLKILNKEFLLVGLAPPAPYRSVDLLKVMKKQFRWTSNKLDYVVQQLGLGKKVDHPGMVMWLDCMNKASPTYHESWDKMEEYNVGDVFLTEELYDKVIGWVPNHPNHAVYDDAVVCPKCGGNHLQKRGWAYTQQLKYRRYQCKDCGGWARSNKREPLAMEERLTQVNN